MSSSYDKDMRNAVEFLPDRLYYVALSSPPPIPHPQKHFFSIDSEMVYWNFYLDFGPLNLGHLYRYCMLLNNKLNDKKFKDKVIYYYSSTHVHKRTNAAFLISAWALLYLNKSPEEAFKPFKGYPHPFPPWHDATPVACTFNLTILDTLRGLSKARDCKFFDFAHFNIEEYEHYEQVENGDLNWYVDGRFLAFAGPHAEKHASPGGYYSLRPEDYIPYFKKRNVSLVVRLNKSSYDGRKFSSQGIEHMELYFVDGSNPPDHILAKFISKCEETSGGVAVHCKAGLGRTGTVIGCYVMKHHRFTAEEIIGWMRIVRPGSVIGPQQQFMRDVQNRMWREGEQYRARMAALSAVPPSLTSPHSHANGNNSNQSNNKDPVSSSSSSGINRGLASLTLLPPHSNSSSNNAASHSPSGSSVGRLPPPDSPSSSDKTQGDLLRIRRQLHAPGTANLPLSSLSDKSGALPPTNLTLTNSRSPLALNSSGPLTPIDNSDSNHSKMDPSTPHNASSNALAAVSPKGESNGKLSSSFGSFLSSWK